MKDKSTVLSLDIVNRVHLNKSMLEKVLMNQRSTGKSISDEQRKHKFQDSILYGDSEEIYTFWDCLAGMKKGNKLLSQLKRGEKDKKEKYEDLLQRARGILKCFVLEIYKSIVDRFDSMDRDFRIKLTVGGFTYGNGNPSSSDFKESGEENFVIELIKKYYEVSHNWTNGCEYDSVKYPLFKVDMGTTVRQYDNSFHDGVSYHLHFISRDIGRLFGHCSDHRDPGKSCKHGLRCRKEIHLIAKDNSGNIVYNVDDDIEYFKEVLTSIGKEVFSDELKVNSFQNESSNTSVKSTKSGGGSKSVTDSKKVIDIDESARISNDVISSINISATRNSSQSDFRNTNISPRNVSQSPVSVGSWADAAKEGQRRARDGSITSVKSLTVSTNGYDIREWTLFWFGDPTKKDPDTDQFQPDGTNNVKELMKDLKLNPNDDREFNNVYKLIRRLFWRSKHNFSKGYKNNSIRLDYDYVKHQYVQYKAYVDGTNFYNIDEISIKSATSEKHLGAEHKATSDDTARFHKDGRKNSYRHNNFGMNDYRPSPGYLVFNLSSDYENINFRYLDVMAEFLNLPLPKDPIFLKPGGISLSDYDKSKAWTESDLQWLDKDNLSLKGGYRDKIKQGNLVMEMLKDDNILQEYKNFLKIMSCSSSNLSPEYYIGNWLMKLDSKNFNCIMFYYENRANKAYEGINIRICIKQYIGYGYDLKDLENPTTMRLHLNGIDMLLANRLPDSFKHDMSNMGREDYINKISDVFINMAILKSLEEKNKSDLKGYLDSIQIVNEDTNSQGEMENLEINYRLESKKYFENKLKFAYLRMMQDSTVKTDLFELVYSKVKEEIEKDKKEGWSIPCVTNAAKGDFYITPKVIQRVIESKLSIKTNRDFTAEMSSVENSIKANKKELGTLKSQLLSGNLSPQDRSSKEKETKILEAKNDRLSEERKKIDDEKNSNRRNYQVEIRNVDSKIKDLKNETEKLKRDRSRILNIGDVDPNKLKIISSEIDENEKSKIPNLLREREILIEKMRNVNQEASEEEWKALYKSLKVVEESGSKIIRDGIDKGASNSDVKVEDVDNYFTKFSNFGGLV